MNATNHPGVSKKMHRLFFCLAITALATPLTHASLADELAEENRIKFEAGEPVIVTIDKEGAVWPEVCIYRKVKARPEVVTDLFLDYEHANTFISNLESAVVENSPDPNTKDVRYKVRLPIIFSITYLVRNSYEKTPEGYIVRWHLLEPPFAAKSAVGSLRVESHGDGAVICYKNHVEPSTRLIAGLRGHAVKEAAKTVSAIVAEAERRQLKNAALPTKKP